MNVAQIREAARLLEPWSPRETTALSDVGGGRCQLNIGPYPGLMARHSIDTAGQSTQIYPPEEENQ